MRALKKGVSPQILTEKVAEWTMELVTQLDDNGKAPAHISGRYRHDDIKKAVLDETLGKCAYCESRIRHIAHGDIEHIIPKSKDPQRSFEWENLTLACSMCNGKKGDYYTSDPARSHENIFDPYKDLAEDHFLFMREIVVARPDSNKGYATDVILELSRNEMIEARRERMNYFDALVRSYHSAADGMKDVVRRDIERHAKSSEPYYLSVKHYLKVLESKGLAPALKLD